MLKAFIKKEPVFFISAICAAVTMLFVPPDREYLHYIDFRVLSILLCLMAVVAGFKKIGIFSALTYHILKSTKKGRVLGVILVILPFFSSMLVTNDVALIIFIPFTVSLLANLGCKKSIVPLIVMQTVAANLGSMATPVGNPQNLFIYSAYKLSAAEFFSTTLPLTAVSLICLLIASLFILPDKLDIGEMKKETINSKIFLCVCAALFILSLLAVFRVLPYQLVTVITVITILILSRDLLKEIDFLLLFTFVCFFVISENLGRVEEIRFLLQGLLEKSTLLTGAGASQIISNVPAAVLLSAFTDNWKELLEGVNIGGLGTPVASLASLITLKFYLKVPEAKIINFLGVFTAVNVMGLAVLLAFAMAV